MRWNAWRVVIFLMVAQPGGLVTPGYSAEVASHSDWLTGSPADVGLDSAVLAEMFDYIREHDTHVHSVQIVRRGRMVLDAYFYPFNAEMRHDVASVTKSVTSTLVGLAIQKGHLNGVKQSLLDLFPDRVVSNPNQRKKRITLEDLLTMRAGWDCGFEPGEARLYEMRRSADWLQFMLDLPMVADPGTRFAYCSGNPYLLSVVLSRTTGTNEFGFARETLFEPLGIRDVSWPADPKGHSYGWGDLQLHPRDMAKLGQLFLQRGRWGERQIVPKSWIIAATRNHVERTDNKDHYGYAWWVKGKDYPGMFEAVGRGGQRITVWPAKGIVVVFTGGQFEPGDLGKFILRALKSDQSLKVNREASAKLQERIVSATKPPPAQPAPKLPATATRISGKVIKMSTNTLGLEEMILKFADSKEASVDFLASGHREDFAIGLDGVDRFSQNTLNGLPTACQGHWSGEDAFMMRINFVGGINCYEVRLTFAAQTEKIRVRLVERTGLNNEEFDAVLSE